MTQWSVDEQRSRIAFSVRHMMLSRTRGHFARWRATRLDLDPQDLTRSVVEVEIDADSIDTGENERDGFLRSADFLDASTHPKLRYRSQRVEQVASKRFRVSGELCIRDICQPVELDVSLESQTADSLRFAASSTLSRKRFGLTWSKALEIGNVLVADEISVEIDLLIAAVPGIPSKR